MTWAAARCALVAVSMVSMQPVMGAPQPPEPTQVLSFAKIPVPAGHLRRGERILIHMNLSVSHEGRVTGCTPLASSGYPALERAACEIYAQWAIFKPARDNEGRAVSGRFPIQFKWEATDTAIDASTSKAVAASPRAGFGEWINVLDLPKGELAADEIVTSIFKLEISADGRVTACSNPVASTKPVLDELGCRLMIKRGRYKPALDAQGQATEGTDWHFARWQRPRD